MGHIAGRIDPDRLSALIGAIYDFAVVPEAWNATLDELRDLLDGANCVLSVADMPSGSVRALKTVGIKEPWLSRMMEFGGEIVTVSKIKIVASHRNYLRPESRTMKPESCSRT
jgi:hypothetical protein